MFDIDKEKWALDLREGTRSVSKGAPSDKADLTLTITDDNFVKLVNGKLGPQQVCCSRNKDMHTAFASVWRDLSAAPLHHMRSCRRWSIMQICCCCCCRRSSCGS